MVLSFLSRAVFTLKVQTNEGSMEIYCFILRLYYFSYSLITV